VINYLKNYIKFHIRFLLKIYRKILFKFDKNIFALLFNFRSLLIQSKARVSWKGSTFSVTEKGTNFKYKIRHQHQCNVAYEFGVKARADSLADVYFLKQMKFKDGDIFLDCGANVGDLKIWFELQNKKIEYIGFEPSPIEFNCLKDNVYPSIVYNIGLWNKDGELTFYISSQGADSSLIEPKKYDKKIVSKVCKLEKFIDAPIKCLKLEAEGAEPEILEGLGDALGMIEYISADLGYERGIDADSTLVPVTNFLITRGFELVDVEHTRICALYKNKHFKSLQPKKT